MPNISALYAHVEKQTYLDMWLYLILFPLFHLWSEIAQHETLFFSSLLAGTQLNFFPLWAANTLFLDVLHRTWLLAENNTLIAPHPPNLPCSFLDHPLLYKPPYSLWMFLCSLEWDRQKLWSLLGAITKKALKKLFVILTCKCNEGFRHCQTWTHLGSCGNQSPWWPPMTLASRNSHLELACVTNRVQQRWWKITFKVRLLSFLSFVSLSLALGKPSYHVMSMPLAEEVRSPVNRPRGLEAYQK